MEFAQYENEAHSVTSPKLNNRITEDDLDDLKFSNQMHSFSNLQSFNDFDLPNNSYIKEQTRNGVIIQGTFYDQFKASIIFTSVVTYKNYQIMRNQFRLIFKVSYPEDFFKKVYDKKYFTVFGMEKSSKELVCFAVIDIKQDERKADILALGVVKEYQNKKFGSYLLRKVLEELTSMGIQDAHLIVQQLNEPALRLYNKFGFTIDQNLPNYYNFDSEAPEENHAYLMKRSLISKRFWIFEVFKRITEKLFLKNKNEFNTNTYRFTNGR